MNLLTFAVRRTLLSVPTVAGIAIMVFFVLLVLPGNPAELIQGEMANPEVTKALIAKWGLDQPPMVRLERWANSVIRLDLGNSLVTGRPVAEMLAPRLGYSAFLGLLGMLLGVLIGLPSGIFSATRPNSAIDYSSTIFVLLGLSLPVFVTGLILQFVLGFHLKLFPISGAPDSVLSMDALYYALLPAVSVAAYQAAVIARVGRTTLLEILHTDYIRTAHSKGASEARVIRGHALPNVLISIVTLVGVNLKAIISGLLLVEIVFGWPGIGRLFYDAVQQRDYPVIQGVALIIGIGVSVLNLLVDMLYGFLDPRIRVEAGER